MRWSRNRLYFIELKIVCFIQVQVGRSRFYMVSSLIFAFFTWLSYLHFFTHFSKYLSFFIIFVVFEMSLMLCFSFVNFLGTDFVVDTFFIFRIRFLVFLVCFIYFNFWASIFGTKDACFRERLWLNNCFEIRRIGKFYECMDSSKNWRNFSTFWELWIA